MVLRTTVMVEIQSLARGLTSFKERLRVHNSSPSTDNNAITVGQGGMVERLRTVKEVMILQRK